MQNLTVALAPQSSHREISLRNRDTSRKILLQGIPNMSILVVRREPMLMEQPLQMWGHSLAIKETMPAALALLQKRRVDLMVMDWETAPDRARRFFGLARRLQSPHYLASIAVTRVGNPDHPLDALLAGADAVLRQNCLFFELLAQLRMSQRLRSPSTGHVPASLPARGRTVAPLQKAVTLMPIF